LQQLHETFHVQHHGDKLDHRGSAWTLGIYQNYIWSQYFRSRISPCKSL